MRSARIVEDIKDRFYFIMRRILEERNLAGVNVPENVLYSRQYDKSYVSQPPHTVVSSHEASHHATATSSSARGSWSTSLREIPPLPFKKRS